MNCAQTRRTVLIDPHRLPEEATTHLFTCSTCQFFYQAQLQQQAQLASVIAQTPTHSTRPLVLPLPDAANSTPTVHARRRFWAAAAALAVSTTGVLGTSIWWQLRSATPGTEHWAQAVRQHFQQDPIHLLPADPKASAHIHTLLVRLGARQFAELPPVIQGGVCQLLDCESVHLVLDWQGQRVVAFLMPRKGQTVMPLAVDGWHGELRPLVGGMVATLAQQKHIAHLAAQALATAVAWPT